MKNKLINKIATFALGIIILSSFVPTASAVNIAQFNTASGDLPTIQVFNSTKYPDSNPIWGRTVSADASDVLSFLIFYHNTSDVTAYNTKLKLNLSSSVSSGNSITATISADNAYSSSGSVNLYLNYGSSLPLNLVSGSARWYTGGYSILTVIPFGQSGDEIAAYSDGLRIGDVSPGSSGHIIVRAQLGGYTQFNSTPYGNVPSVFTNSPSNISASAATLNGSVNPNNSGTTAWFEYGPTQSLGYTTSTFAIGSGNSQTIYSASVFNLSTNTTYYYRAVAKNSYGTAYGTLLTFVIGTNQITTNQDLSGIAYSLSQLTSSLVKLNSMVGSLGADRVTERVIERVEVVSTAGSDLTKLTFTADKESFEPGDKAVFTVQIEPLTNLTNAVLFVRLNSVFEFESTNANTYSKSDNAFTYNIGSVHAGDTQIFKINTHLSSDFNTDNAKNGIVKSTSTFTYADANGNIKTPLYSSLDVSVCDTGFFANVFFALPGGPAITILLIAVLILIVAIAVRKLLG